MMMFLKKNIESILSSYRKTKIEYSQYFIDSVINSYDNSFYIYLFNENKIIGMSRAGVRKDKVELSMVYILHDYRKQGYSYNMLKKFIHFLEKEKEFIKIGLSVEKENIAAFKLYKKLNFIIECEKTEELYENNKLVKYDFIYMYHKLL